MYMADFPILKWMQVDGRSVPFTYPQHQKGNGYVVTGEDNPLPTGNHVMTKSGIWVPQRGTDEGAAHTQLTGSTVEEQYIIDAEAPTDTARYFFSVDASKYKQVYLQLRNSTDKDVNIHVKPNTATSPNPLYWDGEDWGTKYSVTLPPSNNWYQLNTYFSFLSIEGIKEFGVSYRYFDAPTEGSITVKMWGVVR